MVIEVLSTLPPLCKLTALLLKLTALLLILTALLLMGHCGESHQVMVNEIVSVLDISHGSAHTSSTFSITMHSASAVRSGFTTHCAWPGWGKSDTELRPFQSFLLRSQTYCSSRHALLYWMFIFRWFLIGFDIFIPQKRNGWQKAVSFLCISLEDQATLHCFYNIM